MPILDGPALLRSNLPGPSRRITVEPVEPPGPPIDVPDPTPVEPARQSPGRARRWTMSIDEPRAVLRTGSDRAGDRLPAVAARRRRLALAHVGRIVAISAAGRTMPRRRASTRSVPDRTVQLRCLCVVRTVSTHGIGGDAEHRRRRRRDVGRDRTPRRRYARTALPDRGRRSALVPWGKTRPSAQGHRASRCADGAPSRSVGGGSDVRSSGSGRTAATSHPALQPGRHGSASTSKLSIQRSPVLNRCRDRSSVPPAGLEPAT